MKLILENNNDRDLKDIVKEVFDNIYDDLSAALDNVANYFYSKIPGYDISWCVEDASEDVSENADKALEQAAKAETLALFAHHPNFKEVEKIVSELHWN